MHNANRNMELDEEQILGDEQMKGIHMLYRGAKDFMRKADPADKESWENQAQCVYDHLPDGPESRIVQVCITNQVLECLLGHMDTGQRLMLEMNGPMAALLVRAYTELRRAEMESNKLWPQTIPG
jgi:hypothetical protein